MIFICLVIFINIIITSAKLNGEGSVCGRAFGEGIVEEKIVGGFDVGYYKYPWYAALISSNVVACGGSLVGSKTIISAAHCFREYITGHGPKTKLEDVYNVTLGVYNRCQKEKVQKTFFVQKVHIHEKYVENIPYYDISMLILKESTSGYEPICLPKSVIKTRPREGSVPGLGTLRYHGSTPCTLHEARLLIYSDSECRNMINRTGNDPKKFNKAFCAGYLQGGIDTCQGDSGGPFQVTDEFGNYVLLGLVSFGFHCANPNLLGIYTDVSQFVDWIEQKAGFNATMEGSNNSTSVTVVSEPITTKNTPKPAVRPRPVHVIHETIVRPVHIIIFRDRDERKDKLSAVNNKKQHKNHRKTKDRGHTKSKERLKTSNP